MASKPTSPKSPKGGAKSPKPMVTGPAPTKKVTVPQNDPTDYAGLCQKFVEQYTYGKTGIFPSAADAWDSYSQNGQGMTDFTKLSYGDTLYFAPDSSNGYAGHTGIYIGNGKMISATYNGVQVSDVNQWMSSTGQQLEGFVSHTNYSNVPAPQQWPSNYTQGSQNTATDNTPVTWTPAPSSMQDTTGVSTPTQAYTVQAGDTLYGIAQRLLGDGNKWQQLQGFSGDPRQLPIGTQLSAPGGQINPSQNIIQQVLPTTISKLPEQKTAPFTPNSSLPTNPGTVPGQNGTSGLPTNPGANGPAINPQAQQAQQYANAVKGTEQIVNNPIGTAVTAAGGALVNGAEKAFGGLFQPKPSNSDLGLPPSADHLVNPTMNRQFSSNMRALSQPTQTPQQSATMQGGASTPPVISSAGRVLQNVGSTMAQPKQRPYVPPPPVKQRPVAGGGAGQVYNQIGNAFQQGAKMVGNAAQGALGWLANVGGSLN
jgi:LysM repeat protein